MIGRDVLAMHAAVTMLATGDRDGLLNLFRWAAGHSHPVQQEIVEETWICALLRADRFDEARRILDDRLDRRRSPRDARWRADIPSMPSGSLTADLVTR